MYEDEQQNITCKSYLKEIISKENKTLVAVVQINKKGCVGRQECLHVASSVCDKRKDCFGVVWNDIATEDRILFCDSKEMKNVVSKDTLHTFMKSSLRKENFFVIQFQQIYERLSMHCKYLTFH